MGPSVEFGLSLPNRAVLFGLPVGLLLDLAEHAEASGSFKSIWVGDNLLSKPRMEAIVLLSALAVRTSELKLGTVCLASFPLRDPILLALQWASLDILSGGRTILVVCNGGSARMSPVYARELAAMGVANRDRMPRLEEGIEVLRKLWGPGPANHRGRFYELTDVDARPKPIQEHLPIIIAVNPPADDAEVEERALRRVARIADGWQSAIIEPSLFGVRWKRIRQYAEEYGRSDQVTHASCHIMVNINDDAAKARRESAEFLDRYYGEAGGISDDRQTTWLAFGSPDAVIDRLKQYVEAGCSTPILRFTSSDQLGQLERCIEEVLPAFGAPAEAAVGLG
jgi:alkanesulfonate monooxygenase SsuD/methylene tetrahydromethanopterin reductase-like flavin-dependent oxidoreductase (luciferase family)